MKRKYKSHRITLFMSICVSVCSACVCVLLMADEYYTARNKLDVYTNEYQGWEACRLTEPNYFESNAKAVSNCLTNLEEAKGNSWAQLSKSKIIMLFVVAGLGSAIGGYLIVWIFWFIGTCIHRFFRWIKHCFQSKSKSFRISRKNKTYEVREFEEPELYIEKPVQEKEWTRTEELEHQVKILKEEVCSIRRDIERL